MSRGEAEAHWPTNNCVCISISQPQEMAQLHVGFWAILRLQFCDIDLDSYPNGVAFEELSRPFELHDANKIVRFVHFVKPFAPHIVVHCDAGRSRSAAVAEVLLQALPHYKDAGGMRDANNYVRRLLKRAFGLVPTGAEDEE